MDYRVTELHIQELAEHGVNLQKGNLVAIQPFMATHDYASRESFLAKMEGYLETARQQEWLNSKSVVVLPEYIGTWLVATGEKASIYSAPNVEKAMRTLVLSHPFSFLKTLPFARGKDKVKDSLFRMKAGQMASIYHEVFSYLSGKYGVTLVAGSIVLPSARVVNGRLLAGNGPLYNTTVVYRPDGTAYDALVYKGFPIGDELPFTASAPLDNLPVFQTPAGRLGVLICADSWYAEAYQALVAQGCDIIAVPNNLMPQGVWDQPWGGYSPGPEPDDVDPADVGKISEGEAWLKYALAGRLESAGAAHGLHVYFRGCVWDLCSEGRTILVSRHQVIEAQHTDGAAVINYWLS